MKTFLKVIGTFAVVIGFIAIAGSANDCDGRCMENANDIPTMLMVIGYGLVALLGGVACLRASKYF